MGEAKTESGQSEVRILSPQRFEGTVDGKTVRYGFSFYRGETTNFAPTQEGMDKPEAVRSHVLKGWMPDEPFIDADTNIIAFGSCFAANISNYLNGLGFNVATKKDNVAYISRLGDGMVNTHAIRQQFDWAWNNKVPQGDFWHGYKAEEFGYDEQVRVRTRELFDEADVFVITLGLSEIWYDEPTGEVFWRAVPADKYDPNRHKFRVASYEESLGNLRAIYDVIREHRPQARIIFTVSPIALAATFRPIACITANTVSKGILRTAVDQLYREKHPNDDRLFYFPSYEVVLECFRHQFGSDRRHAHPHVLDLNMKAFERYFCKTGLTDQDIDDTFAEALALDKELGGEDKAEAIKRIKSDHSAAAKNNQKHRGTSIDAKVSEAKRAAKAAARSEQSASKEKRSQLSPEQKAARRAEFQKMAAEKAAGRSAEKAKGDRKADNGAVPVPNEASEAGAYRIGADGAVHLVRNPERRARRAAREEARIAREAAASSGPLKRIGLKIRRLFA